MLPDKPFPLARFSQLKEAYAKKRFYELEEHSDDKETTTPQLETSPQPDKEPTTTTSTEKNN